MKKEQNQDIESLIEKYRDSVKCVSQKYYICGGNADDLFQEGMIGFLQAVKDYNNKHGDFDSESFKKFALMCAKRQILDAIKHANRKKFQPLNDAFSIEMTSAGQQKQLDVTSELFGANPENQIIDKENYNEKVNNANFILSGFERCVLEKYLSGNTCVEIAKLFNKDEKSIDNAIQRIKIKLKSEK